MVDDIDDPLKGIKSANEHIRELEALIEEARAKGDLKSAITGSGHLVKWQQILQYWIHQAYQQGKTTEDLSKKASMKKRFEGTSR